MNKTGKVVWMEKLYIENGWLSFNECVLQEAASKINPLIENYFWGSVIALMKFL